MNATPKILAALLACGALSPAAAQSLGNIVDAANFSIDSASPLVYAIGGSSKQRLAQTLTVENSGNLAGVFVPVGCGDGRLIVEIHDVVSGQPGPTILDSRTAAPTAFAFSARFTYVPIPGSLPLTAGQQIAIVLDNKRGTCSLTPSPVSVNYAGGKAYFEALPNPPGWVAFSDFANTPDDIPFQLVLE